MTRFFLQFLVLAMAATAGLLVDISTAYAQAASCSRLESTLATLDRNRAFRDYENNAGRIRDLRRDVQRAESSYVRGGCNDDAKAGRRLSTECRSLARRITQGRAQIEDLSRSVDTGEAVAQQREAILQEMARFGCGRGSDARVERRGRGNLFEQLFEAFGGDFDGEGGVRGEEFNPYGGYHTVRTLCVRKTDGFYWPISYSTLVEYVPNDAEVCRAQCPTLDVDLYYYDNPGQEPEQMVNQFGEPYSALPTAFRFRTEFDAVNRCTAMTEAGAITIAELPGGGTRAMISFMGETFPLPVRDPRRLSTVVAVVAAVDDAVYVDVPLPRRRPAAPGEEPKPVVVVAPAAANQPQRIVQFGDKRVRIVGPDTPYAPGGAAGT